MATFSLVRACMICRCATAVVAKRTLKIYILRGSEATRLRCDGVFNKTFIANLLEIVPSVTEFLKSVNIWWRYEL